MKTLIFLDDERNLSDVTWINYPQYDEVLIVRTYSDFIKLVESVTDIKNYDFSFDHDIQDFLNDYEFTGYDCIKWLCNDYCIENNINISSCNFYYHTQNPIGKNNMSSYINNFMRYFD